jgi:hypothetical protein
MRHFWPPHKAELAPSRNQNMLADTTDDSAHINPTGGDRRSMG